MSDCVFYFAKQTYIHFNLKADNCTQVHLSFSEMFDVFVQTVDAYDIEPTESMVYVTKGSTAILPCVITGFYDTGKDSIKWEKYMLEVLSTYDPCPCIDHREIIITTSILPPSIQFSSPVDSVFADDSCLCLKITFY